MPSQLYIYNFRGCFSSIELLLWKFFMIIIINHLGSEKSVIKNYWVYCETYLLNCKYLWEKQKKIYSSKYSEIQFVYILMIGKSLCVSVSRAHNQIWIESVHYFSSSFKIYIAYEYEYFVQLVFITIYFDRLVWASICIFYLLRLYNHEVFYIIIILNKKIYDRFLFILISNKNAIEVFYQKVRWKKKQLCKTFFLFLLLLLESLTPNMISSSRWIHSFLNRFYSLL